MNKPKLWPAVRSGRVAVPVGVVHCAASTFLETSTNGGDKLGGPGLALVATSSAKDLAFLAEGIHDWRCREVTPAHPGPY